MKKLFYIAMAMTVVCFSTVGCKDKVVNDVVNDTTEIETQDTTIYGVCGEGSSMHSLEIITEEGDTVRLMVDADDDVEGVKGGILSGDRFAVIAEDADGERIAKVAINLTTLEGKWTSLDRNFEILQDGEVLSTLQSESNPYSSWRILNGQLLLGTDTFDVVTLGADSLSLENKKGIFVYKRQ